MSYKFHKDGYSKREDPRPSDRSQMPSTVVPKRVNKGDQRSSEGEALNEPYYPSLGSNPDINNTKSIPDTATRMPDIAIRNDLSPVLELGGLGLK